MKKLGMIAITVALSGILVGTSVVSASVPTAFSELQTWHTSGMTEGIFDNEATKENSVVVDVVQNTEESTAVVNPSESVVETAPEYVAPPVVETAPEYVAPPVVETTPEYVAPPVAETAPVNPPVNEGSGWTPPTAEELEDIFGGIDMENPLWCYDYETGNDYYCVYE